MKKIKKTWIFAFVIIFLVIIIYGLTRNVEISSYNEINSSTEKISSELVEDNFSSTSEHHFVRMPLTYSIDIPSNNYYMDDEYGNVALVGQKNKVNDIALAFKIIEESTNYSVKFVQVNKSEKADIRVIGVLPEQMDEILLEQGDNESGEDILGLAIVKNESQIFKNATIYFQPNQVYTDQSFWNYGRCVLGNGTVFPHLEIHEILHALGIGHNYEKIDSVMFPIKLRSRCKTWAIDYQYINCLKNIYSNGSIHGGCSSNNMFPHPFNASSLEVEDLKWQRFPLTYSISRCDRFQAYKLNKALKDFQTIVNKTNLFVYSENTDSSQVIFSCNLTFYEEDYHPETTDYWQDYRVNLKREYNVSNGFIDRAHIEIFYLPGCDAYGSTPSSIELFAIYRAIGLRNQYGLDTEEAGCGWAMAASQTTLDRIKELYPAYF